MNDKITYECKECSKILNLNVNEDVPVCCGIPMEKLPYCRTTDTAEQARSEENGEPCNDGRAG